jgi:uncharacterized membrane protein
MAEPTKTASNAATEALPTDALKEAGQKLLSLLVQRAAQAATDRVAGLSDRLGDVAEHGGTGLTAALSGGTALAEGKSPLRAALSSGVSGLTESVKNAFSGAGGGGGKKIKVTVISEDQDIGLPLRTTYDLWTQFADFPSFMKKVESVEQADDAKTNWKAQVLWSHRTWEATIVEQVPDSHIVWRSKGPKGHVDGAVTFTELGPNLTRVMLVLEYHPQGLFERTGNLWRAQGRRARLEFQHFRRHAMSNVLIKQDEVEGWRGEIRDSEVVVSHEDAVHAEQEAEEETGQEPEEDTGQEPEEDTAQEPEEDTAQEETERDEDLGPEDEYADEEGDEEEEEYEAEDEAGPEGEDAEGPYDEDDEYIEEGEEPVEDEEYEQVPARAGRGDDR